MSARLYQERSKNVISPGLREMVLIAFEPVFRFAFCGNAEFYRMIELGHQAFDQAFDGCTFTCCIAAIERYHHAFVFIDNMLLGF